MSRVFLHLEQYNTIQFTIKHLYQVKSEALAVAGRAEVVDYMLRVVREVRYVFIGV